MNILVFANGELTLGEWIRPYLNRASALIAADGGLHHLQSLHRKPDVVIGDMDSIDPPLLTELRAEGVKLIVHPTDKDASDLELTLKYAAANYDGEILVLGALGGRLDQLLANVLLLTDPELQGRVVKIVQEHQQAWVITPGVERFMGNVGDLVSLLPLQGDAHIERTAGLKWQLRDEKLIYGQSRGISNIMTEEIAAIEVKQGTLLCVHTSIAWDR